MSLVPIESPDPGEESWVNRLRHMSAARKLGVMALLCLLVTLGLVGFRWSQPEMRPLAAGLSEEQSSQVAKKLDEMKVTYTLSEGGAILVSARDLPKIRMELAGTGLPDTTEPGFSLFDKVNLQMTDFSQKVTYLRALQGELGETIRALPGVLKVRVHLNLPEDSLLVKEQQHPSAAVLLQMKPGASLGRTQCKGILRLVASSVEGLRTQDITLTDTNGSLLFSGDEELGGDSNHEEEALSLTLQRAGQGVVDSVVGPGYGVVNVRVEFQKDMRKVERTVVEPGKDGKGFEKSRKQTEENYEGTVKAGGMPSVVANNTTTTNTTGGGKITEVKGAGERPKYRQSVQQVEFDYGHRVESVEEAPNRIRRITASLMIDGKRKLDKAGLDSLKQAVSLAVGIDATRGDLCSVQMLTFNRQDEQAIQESAALPVAAKYPSWLPGVVTALGVGGVGLLLLLLRRKPAPNSAPAGRRAADSSGLGNKLDISLPGEASLPALAPASTHNQLLDQARKAALDQPEVVARLISNWVNNDRSKR